MIIMIMFPDPIEVETPKDTQPPHINQDMQQTWIFLPTDIQGGMAEILLQETFSSNSWGSKSFRFWNKYNWLNAIRRPQSTIFP
jgi:hypothetical protein